MNLIIEIVWLGWFNIIRNFESWRAKKLILMYLIQ